MRRTPLYANRSHALAARKLAAKSGAGVGFGLEALAVQDFFEDAWTVWGDDRRTVNPCERSLLVWKLLQEQHVLGRTLGTMRLLEGFLEQAAGVFETAPLAATATTSELLKNAVEMLAKKYYATLKEYGLIEPGEAATVLRSAVPVTEVYLAEYVDVLPAQRMLLDAWGVDTTKLDEAVQLEALDDGVVPSFLIPAGTTAIYSLLKDEIESYVERAAEDILLQPPAEKEAQQSMAVLVKEPYQAWNALAPALCEQGITCAVEASVAFLDTWVGKACHAIWQMISGDGRWLFAATDFAYNPLSGMAPGAAEALHVTYRGDRRLMLGDMQQTLAQCSTYGLFAALLGGDVADTKHAWLEVCEGLSAELASRLHEATDQGLIEILRELIVCRIAFDERDRELAMLDELVKTLEVAQHFELHSEDIFDMLLDLSVASAQETCPSEQARGRVVFMPLSAATKLPEKSYGLVILGDVSTDAFNISAEHSSLEAFAAQLGIALSADPLQDAFRLFSAAQKAAKRQFTCVQSLHNEAMEEAFPSCMYDEYRARLRHTNMLAGEPEGLEVAEKRRGEECLTTGLGAMFADLERKDTYAEATRGVLAYASMLHYLPTVEEDLVQVPILSASAIEAYLNCPYQWFISYGLGVSSFDEAYDARAQGTFVHQVLAVFYGRIAKASQVLSEEMLHEGSLFDQVFDEVQAAQWERTHDRLIALTETEKKDLELLREALRRSLLLQVDLPADYQPTCFEYRIMPDEGIDYAGVRLRGSVDRVDVDSRTGDFVVLDYKSSSFGHDAPFEVVEDGVEFSLPPYVQALIYAQAVRRKGLVTHIHSSDEADQEHSATADVLESHCAGALYVGYKAKTKQNLLAGSYDQSRYKVSDFIAKDSQVKGDFAQFLDLVEQNIAPFVQALASGDIAGDPRTKQSCRYCALAGRGQCLARANTTEEIGVGATVGTLQGSAQGVE